MTRLVLGTTNRHKGLEMAALLAPLGLELATLADYPGQMDVVEDGDSFAANARLKAVQQATSLGEWVLAEDSGLSVDALGGAPGIFSARYAGPTATDDANNDRLLAALAATPAAERGAHYVCHLTLADPAGHVRAEAEALCRGRITLERRGSAGFGYDPLFEISEYHRTFGELGPAVKAVLSHRSRAMAALLPQLHRLVDAGQFS